MPIYDYDSSIVAEQLTPPVLRQTKSLAWLNVICRPIQYLYDLIFVDYKDGSDHDVFDYTTAYNAFDKVIYLDNKVYECIKASLNKYPTNTEYWVLVNENFIGASERVKYNSQIILLEYALNKWYRNDTISDQIYIENVTNVSLQFVMSNDSVYSSVMPNDSNNQIQYMGNAPTYPLTDYDFIVWVPNAIFNTLGSDTVTRTKNVESFVNKYVLSGVKYRIGNY